MNKHKDSIQKEERMKFSFTEHSLYMDQYSSYKCKELSNNKKAQWVVW